MSDRAGKTEEDTKSGSGDVSPAEEGLFAPDPGNSGDNDRLCPAEHLDGVVCECQRARLTGALTHVGYNAISSASHGLLVVARPELAECRQRSRTHPHLKVLVGTQVGETSLVGVAVRVAQRPVGRWQDIGWTVVSFGLLDVVVFLIGPRNAFLGKVVRLVLRAV